MTNISVDKCTKKGIILGVTEIMKRFLGVDGKVQKKYGKVISYEEPYYTIDYEDKDKDQMRIQEFEEHIISSQFQQQKQVLAEQGSRKRVWRGRYEGKSFRGSGRSRVVPQLTPGMPVAMFHLNFPLASSNAKTMSAETWKPVTMLTSISMSTNLKSQIWMKTRGKPIKNQKRLGRPWKYPLPNNTGPTKK